jgi:hypothetical protein
LQQWDENTRELNLSTGSAWGFRRCGEGALDFKKHLETAWNTTLQHIVILILMTLVTLGVGFVTLGILLPAVMAGYTQATIQLVREGKEPTINDLFSQMRILLPLCGFAVMMIIAVVVGLLMFVLPALAVVLAVCFGCLYMVPLMTDKKMGLFDAVKSSWRMALDGRVEDHIVTVILFIGLMAIGGSIFFGTLLTMPFAMVFLASVYQEKAERVPFVVSQQPEPDSNETR